MAQSVGVLRAEMEAGQARFGRDMGKARAHASKFNKSAKRGFERTNRASRDMTAAIKRSIAAILIIAGPAVMGQFVKASINAAGDANEAWSKFEAVFKDQAAASKIWANDFADDVGRSSTEVAGWLSTLQDTFVPMGLARDDAAGLSQNLVQLAVDMGSFQDIADSQVVEDLQSAIVGNHETMRKYGIVINETTLKQEAYSSGIAEAGVALTEQNKVLARYNLILAGTKDAQGDAKRTSDSYNNQVKKMESNFRKLSETIGEMFLPTASDAVVAVTDLVSVTDKILKSDEKWGIGLRFLNNVLNLGTDAALALAEAELAVAAATKKAQGESETAIKQTNKERLEELKLLKAAGLDRGMVNATVEAEIAALEILEQARIDEAAAIFATNEALEIENEKREDQKQLLEDAVLWKKLLAETADFYSQNSLPAMDAAMLATEGRIKKMNEELAETNEVMVSAGQIAEIAGGVIAGAFGDQKDAGEKFKGFVIGFIDLLQGVVLASEAASIAVNAIFTGPGAFPLIVASLVALNAAKAGVQGMQFANGGSFIVGGGPGTDKTAVNFKATRGEEVTVRTPAQVAAGAMPGGGGGSMTLNQKIVFQGITPADFVDKFVTPRIERATRAGTTDLIGLKNIRVGSNMGGDLLRTGKG